MPYIKLPEKDTFMQNRPQTSQDVNDESPSNDIPMHELLQDTQGTDVPKKGEVRKGTIARVTPAEILVSIGTKSEGIIPARELERLSEDAREKLKEGQEIHVYVVVPEDHNGNVVLSLARAQEETDWTQAEDLRTNQEVYQGRVDGFNKGGLIVKVGNLRGFVPASQFSLSRRHRSEGETVDQKWSRMVGEPICVKVIEVDRSRNRLILSERAAAKESRESQKERLLQELQEGEVRTGHVISLANFGAFVDLGGADGLVHLSEITWKRISHPSEVLKVGQTVKVKVISMDRERKRISLSMKSMEEDPFTIASGKLHEGQLVSGTITKLTKFGAFARIEGFDDIEGLIHITELSENRVEHPKEIVQVGQALTLRVVKIDVESRRIGLSVRRVTSAQYADLDWDTAMKDLSDSESSKNPEPEEDPESGKESEPGKE
ncbi:MAG: S1 RNA-binding domain-containing protein [Anaerolineales bacterium]|nr:S1 RNA-binding domain-containing protein [Anaerolineales bacterium]